MAAPRCDDGAKNGTETDVDCGGSCAADCANGRGCALGSDCQSGLCQNQVCTAPAVLGANVQITSDWNAGYCANITVTNRSTSSIKGWIVVFDMNQSSMNNGWSAQYANSGTRYTARAMSWNALLASNQTTTFGFCATKAGSNYRPSIVSAATP